ncbi:MAG: TraR/DksA C4-type zinc finger protein [Actinobacteria bacterium]|nr:TraR/DksA C4-type zinc finger protein [Actinomycetota bacterium]MCL6104619.1 TraR/DksA C4-type zinc finger protein [Actinomycetota bacterium]
MPSSKLSGSTSRGKKSKLATKETVIKKEVVKKEGTRKKTRVTPRSAAKKQPLDDNFLDKNFLSDQRKALLKERETYLAQIDDLKAETDLLIRDMEPKDVQFDEESGEGGSSNMELEIDLVLSAQASQAVEEITHALAKIDSKSYGICEECNKPISKARLKALPYARLCVVCKSGGLSSRR